MKRLRKLLRSPITTGVLFALAAVMLVTSSVGGARAALQYTSEYYTTQVKMYDIGVSLVEKSNRDGSSNIVSARNFIQKSDHQWNTLTGVLAEHMLPAGDGTARHVNNIRPLTITQTEDFQIGKTYDEVLSVLNSGSIDQYVRVTVYKYWVDVNEDGTAGDKRTDLDPSLIDLHFVTGNGWTIDESASTKERTVLYYASPLGCNKEDDGEFEQEKVLTQTGQYESVDTVVYPSASTPFADTLTVLPGVMDPVESVVEYNGVKDGMKYHSVTTSYVYNNVAFQIEVQVDAVQTHNVSAAKISAWGQNK